jgi:hypothetical protein
MVKCKICETDIDPDQLGYHSAKCREVHELKEHLDDVKGKIFQNTEKAYEMKNMIQTNAALHRFIDLILFFILRQLFKKTLARSNSSEAISSPDSKINTGSKKTKSQFVSLLLLQP